MRAVVVGSGFGGLAAAIRLAAAGHDVTVLEKRDRIGGRAYQYELGGFRFDGGPTVLTAPFMFEELFALAGESLADHVELVALDPFYRSFDAEGRAFDYHASESAMLAEVAARSPSDAAGFQRLGQRISGIFDAFYPYTERPMMRLEVMLAMLPYLVQHRAMLDVNRLVNSCVRDPFLRQALSFHPLLIGGDPARTPALYALIVEFERRWGVHYAMGGTGALVGALGDLLERLGGRMVLEADVERVLVADGRAVGVQLADSTTYAADVVVSNADPGFTYGSLLGGEPRARPARARMRQARQSMSLHVLYFGADRTWPDSPLAHHNMLFARDQRAALRRVFPSRILGFPRPARNETCRPPTTCSSTSTCRPGRIPASPRPAARPSMSSWPRRHGSSQGPIRRASRRGSVRPFSTCWTASTFPGSLSTSSSSTRSARSTSGTSSTRRRVRPSRCNRRSSSQDGSGLTTDRGPSGGSTWSGRGRIREREFRLSWPRGRSPQS